MDALIEELDNEQIKKELPVFDIGDTVRVSTRIVEGEKERVQVFQGTVIAKKGGGLSETFALHRVSYGEGMERVFNIHSPRIVKIEVIRKGDVRRAKLYHLRGTTGKASKVQEKIGVKKAKVAKAPLQSKSATEEAASEALTETAPATESS
ncbi:MAG: hypothetical protein S4CHLAM45_02420 [Chlamydiales bacterium]|nr:hypothetical protein [Chlamydiales bacterium]MCH9619101.1 hypothetical protein [Chlamydiales bacterium]MCH9622363.1 hypothetical protein [Chlamydiales bacterium]